MYNLILKDILLQKRMILVSFFYGVFFILVFNNNLGSSAAIIAGTVAISYFFIINACGYEDKYRGFTIFSSLPVRKWYIVISKYLSIFVFALIGMVFMTLIQFLLTSFGILDGFEIMTIETAVGSIISACVLGAIYYPLYFKIGYMKSKYVVFIFFMVIGFLPGFLISFVDKAYALEKMQLIISRIGSVPDLIIGGIILGIAFIMLLISMIVSIRIFVRKDL